jgi:hypothetical protein
MGFTMLITMCFYFSMLNVYHHGSELRFKKLVWYSTHLLSSHSWKMQSRKFIRVDKNQLSYNIQRLSTTYE